jgi:DNA repair exonuclease SbcCD ATPase subunit
MKQKAQLKVIKSKLISY